MDSAEGDISSSTRSSGGVEFCSVKLSVNNKQFVCLHESPLPLSGAHFKHRIKDLIVFLIVVRASDNLFMV